MSDQRISFYGLKQFYENHKKEILDNIDAAFCNGQFLKGSVIKKFEYELAIACNRKYAKTVSSCTDALYFALKVLGIEQGDEVIVTSFSFISSASSILRTGAKPVFIDIDPDNFMMNTKLIEKAITSNTKAIIAVHLFGQTVNFEAIEEIAEKHGIQIIEDAAQSLGSAFNNRPSGNLGNISCISFDPTKIIGGFGTGGVVLTDNEEKYEQLQIMSNNGKSGEKYLEFGYNSQITTAQASLLSWQLSLIDTIIKKRQDIANIYNTKLNDLDEIQIPAINNGSTHVYHKYVILAEQRDNLKTFLEKNNIETVVHYKEPLPNHPVFNENNSIITNLQVVHEIKDKVLSLPIYPDLSIKEINYICEKIRQFYK